MGMRKTDQISDFGTLVASAEQLLIASFNDDVVRFKSVFHFDIPTGQMSTFQIKIDSNIQITNVTTTSSTLIKK
jgi:hypothetical protein